MSDVRVGQDLLCGGQAVFGCAEDAADETELFCGKLGHFWAFFLLKQAAYGQTTAIGAGSARKHVPNTHKHGYQSTLTRPRALRHPPRCKKHKKHKKDCMETTRQLLLNKAHFLKLPKTISSKPH